MVSQKKCRFCNIINGDFDYQIADNPFMIHDDYIAITSIGALVEGWVLIVPKEHKFSIRNLYAEEQFQNFTNNVIARLQKTYGRVIAFEHGANMENSITSCGTEHAHLHIVPFQTSLIPEFTNKEMLWHQVRASQINQFAKEKEYLFYADIDDSGWKNPNGLMHILDQSTSQYFRKIIAAKVGCLERADYKVFPQLEISERTRSRLAV